MHIIDQVHFFPVTLPPPTQRKAVRRLIKFNAFMKPSKNLKYLKIVCNFKKYQYKDKELFYFFLFHQSKGIQRFV